MKQLLVVALLSLSALAACKTQFIGDPHYPGGPQACQSSCASQNMEMSGFVYSGEFASSCVCGLPDHAPQAADDDTAIQAAADTAAIAGVAMQTDDDDDADAAAARHH